MFVSGAALAAGVLSETEKSAASAVPLTTSYNLAIHYEVALRKPDMRSMAFKEVR